MGAKLFSEFSPQYTHHIAYPFISSTEESMPTYLPQVVREIVMQLMLIFRQGNTSFSFFLSCLLASLACSWADTLSLGSSTEALPSPLSFLVMRFSLLFVCACPLHNKDYLAPALHSCSYLLLPVGELGLSLGRITVGQAGPERLCHPLNESW